MKTLQKYLLIFIMAILMIGCTSIQTSAIVNVEIKNGEVKLESEDGVKDSKTGYAKIIDRYKSFITFAGGIATMSFILIFMKHFIELGAKANNPMERRQIAGGLLWSGLAAALLGSITFVFSLAYSVFK